MTSAYPTGLDALVRQVQARAAELGKLPSRNMVMGEFKVGAPKATAVLKSLKESGFEPVSQAPVTEVATPRRLHSVPVADPAQVPVAQEDTVGVSPQVAPVGHPVPAPVGEAVTGLPLPERAGPTPVPAVSAGPGDRVRTWPLLLLALGAFVSIWGGWVGLGKLTGFGPITLLPGIADGFVINSAITLPIGVEAYAAFALRVWLASGKRPDKARRFAMWSAIGSLVLGMAGQVAYHLMTAAGMAQAPWQITTFVSCLPVVVLGCGAALAHLLHADEEAAR